MLQEDDQRKSLVCCVCGASYTIFANAFTTNNPKVLMYSMDAIPLLHREQKALASQVA